MNANVMKTNNKRLLAAIMMLALVACAFVAFTPSADATDGDEVTEATSLPAANSEGVIVLTENVTLAQAQTIVNQIDIGEFTLTIKADVTVDFSFTEGLQHVFTIDGGAIVVDGGKLTISADNATTYIPKDGNGNHVFCNEADKFTASANVYLKSGTMTVTEDKAVNGQLANGKLTFQVDAGTASFNTNGMGPAYIIQKGGNLSFNLNDGSISAYVDIQGGAMTISGTNTSGSEADTPNPYVFKPYAMNIASGATLNVDGKMSVYNGTYDIDSSITNSNLAIKTVTNNGTINVLSNGSIDVPAGASLAGTGKLTNANADSTVEQTVSQKTDITAAISNEMVDSIVYTGEETLDVIMDLAKPLTVNSIDMIATGTTLAKGGSITIKEEVSVTADITVNGITLYATSGDVSGFTAKDVTLFFGSAGIEFTDGNGTLAIDGEGKIKGSVADNASVVIKNTDISSGNVTVDAVGDIILGDESSVTIEAGVIFNAGSYIKSADTSEGITITVQGTFAYNTVPANVTIVNDGGVVKIQDGQGTENQIAHNQSVNGYQYLTSDTTILSGVTLTIPRNSTLDLNGHDLIIYGTLVIEGKGVVTSGAKIDDSYGDIVLKNGGAIQNEGIIGDAMLITIANGEKLNADESYQQSISMVGVSGVSIGIDRGVEGTQRVYNMVVSGSISKITGVDKHELTLNGVQINADMTINKDVKLTIDGKVTVAKDVTFTNNGDIMNIGGESGEGFFLSNGASAVINAHTVGKISVETGKVGTGDVIESDGKVIAYVDFADDNTNYGYITGITVSAGRVTIPIDDSSEVYQRMYVSGNITVKSVLKADGSADTNKPTCGTFATNGVVYIDGTLSIPEEVTAFDLNNGYIDVSTSGTVVVAENDLIGLFSGAMYSVETTSENVTTETFYYTNFASAMEDIANAVDGTVYINGNFEITGTFTVGDNQEIALDNGTFTYTADDKRIVVGEAGAITVTEDGTITDDAFYTILGSVTALAGTGYTPNATYVNTEHYIYSVIAVDEETDDTVYSGFKYAMDNAAAGQTITVVGDATYKGNLVVPAQITVTVEDTIKLTVTGNVTVEADGKLVLGNTSQLIVGDKGKTSSVTVAGELDASEAGVINAAAGATAVNVYSTGTLTYVNAINSTNVKVNAAYYNEADEYVYTSVAKAVAYAMENDLPLPIHATGVFSEAGTIESDGVSIVIDPAAVVTLGNIILNDATISGTGDYSATVSGLTGAGDAATTSTVSVTKTSATISSTVTLNAEGVNEYALTINAIDGNTTVVAGTVEFVGDTINAYKDNALTIATGATLLLGEGESFDIDGNEYILNEGTILIEGDVTIIYSTILPGQVTVADDGSLTVNATYQFTTDEGIQTIPVSLAVTGNVTVEADGAFIVNGILMMGETPELLGSTTSGTIDGKVTLNGTAYVFAGAPVADTEFVSAQATEINTTAYSINGIDLVTVYTFENEYIDNMYIDTIVYGLDDLDTWMTVNNESVRADIVWYSGESDVGTSYIGEYAEVSTEIRYNAVPVTISIGSHISLSIDNVIVDAYNGYGYSLTIGTHTISAVVDPGFSGDITITFNGQTVSNGGQIVITSDMINALEYPVLSVTGSLTQDSTVVIDGGESGDSGMGLTDYLLIILVILIVIMAIMVAMRLMRS